MSPTMAETTNGVKPWILWTAMLLLMALTVYVTIESAVQLFFAERSGAWKYLADFRAKAQQAGLSLEQYGNKVGLDPYLGWGSEEARVHEPSNLPVSKTILFVGDSVTAGHDVRAGEEDYPALLSAKLGGQGVKVVNLAARGYGVDQMWLKLLTQSERYRPTLIVFAYIPHDLLRPANDFNFGLPKPKFHFSGATINLNLAEGIKDYHAGYDAARSGFHLSGWFASHYLKNSEHYLPAFSTDYFSRLYSHIGEGLARLSHERGIPVVVVKLTNYRQFNGSAKLIELAASGLVRRGEWDKADVRYLDTDGCVSAKAQALGIDVEKEFAHHPGPAGHRLLAECVGAFLEPVLAKKP